MDYLTQVATFEFSFDYDAVNSRINFVSALSGAQRSRALHAVGEGSCIVSPLRMGFVLVATWVSLPDVQVFRFTCHPERAEGGPCRRHVFDGP